MTNHQTVSRARPNIAVIGSGYIGLTAAIALANDGAQVEIIGPQPPNAPDTRSTALFPQSVALLEEIGVWETVRPTTRPLAAIRIIDDTKSVFRSPEITFRASEIGLDALAINVPNAELHRALVEIAAHTPSIKWTLNDRCVGIIHANGRIAIRTESGATTNADIVIAADGRNSVSRAAAGISVKSWSYPQTAIALAFTHTASHDDISTEFHRPAGPFTTVPGPPVKNGYTSHLVWIETPDDAAEIDALPPVGFKNLLEDRLHGLLGQILSVGTRTLFPIEGKTAATFAAKNTFLVGETAHVLPPIGAQGMNLGLRDVIDLRTALAKVVGKPDIDTAMTAYKDTRKNDVWIRTTAVDLLNRSLTTPYWPIQGLRGAGLHILNTVPALKHATMRAGFGH